MTDQRPVIDIRRIEHGWANVTIRVGHRLSDVTVSNLSDGLGEFVAAIEQVAGGSLSGAECRWEHEQSGISAVTVRRCGAAEHEVELRIDAHDGNNLSPESVPEYATELRAVVDVRDLARATLTAFERLRENYGITGYEERWRLPLPQTRLDAIAEVLRELDWHHSATQDSN